MLREGDTAKARLVKTFREAGDVENNTAGK
jgi:hypothetical protein